jgi:hypothetical protein
MVGQKLIDAVQCNMAVIAAARYVQIGLSEFHRNRLREIFMVHIFNNTFQLFLHLFIKRN